MIVLPVGGLDFSGMLMLIEVGVCSAFVAAAWA
jgi:hypothetical protein